MTSWLAAAAVLVWLGLLVGHGGFWRADQRLPISPGGPVSGFRPSAGVSVVAVVPARDEADVVEASLASLLDQAVDGELAIFLVDDESTDGTANRARALAARHPQGARLRVVAAPARSAGWVGKMWAVATGIAAAEREGLAPRHWLLTDADIVHPPDHVRRLLLAAEGHGLDLVSQMVRLESRGAWARLTVPAFVYFFQKLYPFARVNEPTSRVAGAAGGCMLVRAGALARAGGIAAVRGDVIDDCALARRIKRRGRIWLGLSEDAFSVRRYRGLAGVWNMVARTAFTQLRHSWTLLALTVAGLAFVYLVPPALVLGWPWHRDAVAAFGGALAWGLMTWSFVPTLRLYRAPWLAPLLPAAGAIYCAMTVDSARRHFLGRGAEWKGRVGAGG